MKSVLRNVLLTVTAAAIAATVSGCAGGYVEGGGVGVAGPAEVQPEFDGNWGGPYVDYLGGFYERDRGRDVRGFSDRGSRSRSAAHSDGFAGRAPEGRGAPAGGGIAHGGGGGGHR